MEKVKFLYTTVYGSLNVGYNDIRIESMGDEYTNRSTFYEQIQFYSNAVIQAYRHRLQRIYTIFKLIDEYTFTSIDLCFE